MAMWKIMHVRHCQVTRANALIAVRVTSQTRLYTEMHVMQSMSHLVLACCHVCFCHFANAHEEHGAVSNSVHIHRCLLTLYTINAITIFSSARMCSANL